MILFNPVILRMARKEKNLSVYPEVKKVKKNLVFYYMHTCIKH